MTPKPSLLPFVFATTAFALDAGASENFPNDVAKELHLKNAPECTLCHKSNLGGENTTTQPFGRTMQRLGAVKKNDDSLVAALREDEAEGIDSDGDCIPDAEELQANPPTNPNVPDGKGHCQAPARAPELETGCSASPHGAPSALETLALVSLSCGFFSRRKSVARTRVKASSKLHVPES